MPHTRPPRRLDASHSVLVLVDLQEKLCRVMDRAESLVEETVRLISGLKVLGVPVLHSEQNPRGLGPTVPQVVELLSDAPTEKLAFSSLGVDAFADRLAAVGRRQILLAGIEAHVCVYQTGLDLIEAGYELQVVADAVSSRTGSNRRIGLRRLEAAGASITSVETCLFEMLAAAEGDTFKQILRIVK